MILLIKFWIVKLVYLKSAIFAMLNFYDNKYTVYCVNMDKKRNYL